MSTDCQIAFPPKPGLTRDNYPMDEPAADGLHVGRLTVRSSPISCVDLC
jgi:hypothetical protein